MLIVYVFECWQRTSSRCRHGELELDGLSVVGRVADCCLLCARRGNHSSAGSDDQEREYLESQNDAHADALSGKVDRLLGIARDLSAHIKEDNDFIANDLVCTALPTHVSALTHVWSRVSLHP
jgi:hypothetical protein